MKELDIMTDLELSTLIGKDEEIASFVNSISFEGNLPDGDIILRLTRLNFMTELKTRLNSIRIKMENEQRRANPKIKIILKAPQSAIIDTQLHTQMSLSILQDIVNGTQENVARAIKFIVFFPQGETDKNLCNLLLDTNTKDYFQWDSSSKLWKKIFIKWTQSQCKEHSFRQYSSWIGCITKPCNH